MKQNTPTFIRMMNVYHFNNEMYGKQPDIQDFNQAVACVSLNGSAEQARVKIALSQFEYKGAMNTGRIAYAWDSIYAVY